ncbi:hypothetical protein [Allopontixanthobacter sediminis]|uniref:Uncharacterized protein n=1 Tax=Allopontixanthobacter sediminis TaxID=1689985 RepID=A0A845B752_9SPHN|nr:hypothetical protein [Allopontixanthobacter sediminis]MXP43459.1 hypothetical protein [Allopontixanthobacter sediminis]
MTDHPSTYHADPENVGRIDWDDRASLHRKDDGHGVLDSAKGLRRGTLAELVRHVQLLPEEERQKYVIQKAGDHRLGTAEIEALAAREDFPPPE